MATKNSAGYELTKGIIKENPLLILMLGTCPALAVTTSAMNGLGMGVATTAVLVLSNLVISMLRKAIPDRIRIPAYITIIASLVTILQFLLQAYVPALNASLGIFIPLITVNCIILGRAEAFANSHGVFISVIDGLGMGTGFTLALFVIGSLREILGFGTFFDYPMPWIQEGGLQPMMIFGLPAGGFAIFGIMVAITQKMNKRFYGRRPQKTMEREHYPGSISVRTDTIFEDTAVFDGPRPPRTPGRGAVPPAATDPGAFVKEDEAEENSTESEATK
ncbi:MAG: electron transport complex subunit E [Clostridiaceae bacterium]|jgi:electron transport complex protein RnfE|nr:electron transport complex subunit E [Clostridiaceae bacterium]